MPLAQRQVPLPELHDGMVAILGVPVDAGSSFLRGCAAAPRDIRQALLSPATNLCCENGLDLDGEELLVLAGDLDLPDGDGFVAAIDEEIRRPLETGARLLSLGGDHAVTYPLVRSVRAARSVRLDRPGGEPMDLLHLDAHPDLYDRFLGSRHSHASPFARIMEEGLVRRLLQIGVRTMTRHQREQAARFGVEVVEMRRWSEASARLASLEGPLYLSLDLDVLDPAYAPGVSHWEPGGASVRQVLDLLSCIGQPVVGADVVELNPARDPSGRSAAVAAKLVKEIAAIMLAA